MPSELENVIETLDLEQLELNLYRGRSPQVGWQRVFGGQVIGQALVAATRTIDEEKPVHSLHGYFMRPGDPGTPIVYQVDRHRDGKSFATRHVVAIQNGEAIFTMIASFHALEPGLAHHIVMPRVPAPEDLPAEREMLARFADRMPDNMRRYFTRERPVELRHTDFQHYLQPARDRPPVQNVWFRVRGTVPDSRTLTKCLLAYASDMTLLDTCLVPHGRNLFDPSLMMASLDHTIWFHEDFRFDDWLLYAQDSPWAGKARGFNRGSIFSRDGVLIASVAQEGLVRQRRTA